MSKRYEILKSLPAYGPMYVPIAEDGRPFYYEGFPVRFYKSDGSSWVANFNPGWTKVNAVYDFPQFNRMIVIAGGTVYIMNPDEEKPRMIFNGGICEVLEADNGYLVCDYSGIEILIFDVHTGWLWCSPRISWDGFDRLQLDGDMLTGFSYDIGCREEDMWIPFTLNIETKELSGGSYSRYNQMQPLDPDAKCDIIQWNE